MGLGRLLIIKVLNRKYFDIHSLFQYFGPLTNIDISGRFKIGNKCYFSRCGDIYIDKNAEIRIADKCFMNKNYAIAAKKSIKIGSHCSFGPNISIYDHDHNFFPIRTPHQKLGCTSKEIEIGNNVWVGANVTICKGVTIGNNVVVGANSVVTKNIPSNCVAVGAPAKVVKQFHER